MTGDMKWEEVVSLSKGDGGYFDFSEISAPILAADAEAAAWAAARDAQAKIIRKHLKRRRR